MTTSRRDFLLGSGAAGLGCGCARRPRVEPGAKVVIVGAGFAGIGAARALRKAGYATEIVEARDRIGGRAWTKETTPAPVDLGASWLHSGAKNALAGLARESGLAFNISDYNNVDVFGLSGSMVEKKPITQVYEELDIADRFKSQLFWPYLRWRLGGGASGRSIGDVWEEAVAGEVDALSGEAYRMILETQYAVPLHEEAMESLFLGGEQLPNHEWFMTGGMQTFADYLAKDLQVRLSTHVREIEWSRGAARIVTNNGEIEAAAVVLTVSAGLLKRQAIRLTPGLPADARAALDRLGMGLLNKIALSYPSVSWPVDSEYFVLAGGELPAIIANHPVYSGAPVLLGLTGGATSRRLETMSDEEAAARLHRDFERALGLKLPEPDGAAVTRWASDPLAGGSYSHRKPGARLDEGDILARPVDDTLFLAGEAIVSDDDAGNVSGAYRSGQRAAAQIAGLSAPKKRNAILV
ncbi:flavin monoamine oxidase family protein [Hyphococcus luteus]|nr:NAD(P)/FAD-dependent oxidoreductase [Marinicaulis flavus]